MDKLWRSGILLSAASFAGGGGNYLFTMLLGRRLDTTEFGYVGGTLAVAGLLALPLAIAIMAITHYISHFRTHHDEARLQGLLHGCQKFLLWLTVATSVGAVLLLKPLSDFFQFARPGLMLAAMVCLLVGLWSGLAVALCQGMAWFKRMAFIGIAAVGLKLGFGYVVTAPFPVAETGVYAAAFGVLANLALLYWWKDWRRKGETVSPWNREFVGFFLVAAAVTGGSYAFFQGDLLVAQRNFPKAMGPYTAAGQLGRALPMVVAPLLTVLFTARSGRQTERSMPEQMKLLGLYAAGLLVGAGLLALLRGWCVKMIFGQPNAEAAAMVVPFGAGMVFIGLLQALATWALASRWWKVSLLYGVLGLGYWLLLLSGGKTPGQLLHLMPLAAGGAFVVLLTVWLLAWRKKLPANGAAVLGSAE